MLIRALGAYDSVIVAKKFFSRPYERSIPVLRQRHDQQSQCRGTAIAPQRAHIYAISVADSVSAISSTRPPPVMFQETSLVILSAAAVLVYVIWRLLRNYVLPSPFRALPGPPSDSVMFGIPTLLSNSTEAYSRADMRHRKHAAIWRA